MARSFRKEQRIIARELRNSRINRSDNDLEGFGKFILMWHFPSLWFLYYHPVKYFISAIIIAIAAFLYIGWVTHH